MLKRNRYSLVHVAKDDKVTTFALTFEENGKLIERKKFPLTQLDALTTRLGNEDDLYFIFRYYSGEEISGGNFYIQYRQDNKDKRIRIVGPNDINLKNICNNNLGNDVLKRDTMFENYVISVLCKLKEDYKLFKFLIKSEEKYINKYVLKQIYSYYNAVDCGDENFIKFYFNKVCEAMSSYKIIRNIEDGIKCYKEKSLNNKEDIEKGKTKIKKMEYEVEEDGQMSLF